MIRSFKHRGLKALYDGRIPRRVAPNHIEKLRDILLMLEQSHRPADMSIPSFRLHPLKGQRKGTFTVTVSGNWRVTFRFEDGDAFDVDYIDYH